MKKTISLLSFITLAFAVSAQITSTFDTNADGWTFLNSATPITPNHSTTGGNPAGFISAAYSASVGTSTQSWIAPAKFLGSQVMRSMDMNLRFDLQQSQAGTNSNANGDVRIESSSIRLVYSLPVKPAVAPGWSSYSLKLDETQGWRLNNTTGAFATRTQIIAVLSNITAIEIRGTYATNATYTSGIDNVILEQRTLSPSPTIASFTPTSGEPGTVLTITGTSFDTTPNNNAVYFGSMAGTITSASATQLSVTIPIGASHGPITVINKTTGASKRSEKPFNPTFTEGGRIIPASFKPRFDILLGTTPGNDLNGLVPADLDGDGWNDLLVTESLPATVSIFRNLGSGGNLSAASFAPKILLASSGAGNGLFTFDLDGDGKLDVVSTNASSFTTYRNTSTPGNLSFEPVELWPNPIVGITSDVVDVDGDGRLDLIGQHYNGSVAGDFWIALNISSPGNIEFGASITYFGGSLLDAGSGVTSGDLDNDGKPDLIVRHWFGGNFSIIKNNSTPGSISLGTPIQFAFGSYANINISDFNGDGKNDIAWKDGSGNNDIRIRINTNSGGTLAVSDFATEVILDSELTNYGGMSVADVNGDGKPDIIATDAADVGVFENNYSGGAFDANAFVSAYQLQGFSAATYPFSPIVADLNGDKKLELILGYTNSSPKRISIFENKNVRAPEISINTVSPLAAPVGATLTITGDYFSTVPAENVVMVGGVRATVLTATKTELTATVPGGCTYGLVSVTRDMLTAEYRLPFKTTFSSGVTFDNTHFSPPVNFTLTTADYDVEVGDLNKDGMPEVVAEGITNRTYIFRNTHTSGALSSSSLMADDTISSGASNPRLMDIDGDGYLDIIGSSAGLSKNLTTSSEVNFSPIIGISIGANHSFGDFNFDGKMDIVGVNGGNISIAENRSSTAAPFTTGAFGTLSTIINYAKPTTGGGTATADFDNDGWLDFVATNPGTDNVTVWRNGVAYRINTTQFAALPLIAVGDNPGRIYPGDLDGDGKMDLVLYHGTGTTNTLIIVLHNTSTVGNISFDRIDLTNPSATTVATIADLDGDGKPEIITTSETGNRFSIFKNLHTSGALTAASFAAPFNTTVTAPRGITTGDLNLDGKPEIILTRAAGLLVVYENLVPTVSITLNTQPSPSAVCNGVTTSFTTSATGTTNITYQWQFSTTLTGTYTDINNGGGYSTVNTASLSVNTTSNFGAGFYRCRITGDLAATVFSNAAQLTINAIPAAPTITNGARCGAGSVTLVASGGVDGQYRWYTTATGGIAIAGEVNSNYVTPALTSTTSYFVSINNGCESTRTPVTATVAVTPAPTTTGANVCPGSSVALTATGGTNGQYNWYPVATGGTAITGATNNTHPISSLTATTTFYVSLTISGCESARTPVTASVVTVGCAPVITAQTLSTQVEGKIEVNLQSLITTPGTLDPTSIKVITQPASGAIASIANFLLVIDYKGKPFSGKETIIIEACNTNGLCTQQTFTIEVAGEVIVFNAVSPNGDGKNEFLVLQYIESISPNNQVSIYNRWGDEVFSISDYDNKTRVFAGLSNSGNQLPSGTYFYKIAMEDKNSTKTGYLSLKR